MQLCMGGTSPLPFLDQGEARSAVTIFGSIEISGKLTTYPLLSHYFALSESSVSVGLGER